MRLSGRLKTAIFVAIRVIVAVFGIRSVLEGRLYTGLQCLLTLALFMLPGILDRRLRIELPSTLEYCVIFFIFASTFLGEVRDYYGHYPIWDTLLHTCSGFLTAAIGFSLIDLLNRSEQVKLRLSPGFAALFAFCFAMTAGVVWEFYEYGMDRSFDMDMQKDVYVYSVSSKLLGGDTVKTAEVESATLNGEALPGLLDIGLNDTMKDLIVGAVGAASFSAAGCFYFRRRGSGWVSHFMPRRR